MRETTVANTSLTYGRLKKLLKKSSQLENGIKKVVSSKNETLILSRSSWRTSKKVLFVVCFTKHSLPLSYLLLAIGSSLHWQNIYVHFLYSYQHQHLTNNIWQNNLIFTNIIQYLQIFYIHNEYLLFICPFFRIHFFLYTCWKIFLAHFPGFHAGSPCPL